VVTFTYVDPEHRNLDAYIAHLRTYRPLFRQLPGFQFLYISTAASLQKEAAELFSLLVEGKGVSDLNRYFDLETKWEREQYRLVTEQDAIFLSQARKRYTGESIGTLYYLWRRNQLPTDFQAEAAPTSLPSRRFSFEPSRCMVTKRFSETAQRTGVTAGRYGVVQGGSPRGSLPKPPQTLQRRADA